MLNFPAAAPARRCGRLGRRRCCGHRIETLRSYARQCRTIALDMGMRRSLPWLLAIAVTLAAAVAGGWRVGRTMDGVPAAATSSAQQAERVSQASQTLWILADDLTARRLRHDRGQRG